jgi:hypothetical protein
MSVPIYCNRRTATLLTECALHGVGGLVTYVALTSHGLGLAKRVVNEQVFVASGGGNGVLYLAPPISRFRDDDRADRSPSQDPTWVFFVQHLDQDLDSTLAQEAFRHSVIVVSGGQRR